MSGSLSQRCRCWSVTLALQKMAMVGFRDWTVGDLLFFSFLLHLCSEFPLKCLLLYNQFPMLFCRFLSCCHFSCCTTRPLVILPFPLLTPWIWLPNVRILGSHMDQNMDIMLTCAAALLGLQLVGRAHESIHLQWKNFMPFLCNILPGASALPVMVNGHYIPHSFINENKRE